MKSQTKECLMCRNPAFISWHFLSTSWELWKRKKGQHQMKGLSHFFFFFMSSCSCLCLFRTSVFRFEWQENVAGTSARLRAIPTVFHISARPLCDGQLRNSVYTWRLLIYTGRRREQGTIQSPDSTSVFIFPPHAERRNKREPGDGGGIMWNKSQPSRGMFDMDLDCEGAAWSQMCVFVIKQVWVFYLREQTGEKADLPVRALCFTLLFLMLHDHKHQFYPASLQPRHCPHPLTTTFCLEDSSFWFVFSFKTNAQILWENRCSRSLI